MKAPVQIMAIAALLGVGLATSLTGNEGYREGVDDALVTDRIAQELHATVQLRDADIDVSTNKGVVTLEGAVYSVAEKLIAEQLCRNLFGVVKVENKLKVVASSDEAWNVAPNITRRLAEDSLLKDKSLTVKSSPGIVTLDGRLTSPYQKAHAERIARQVPGVMLVRNEIDLQPESDESLRTAVLDHLDGDSRFDSMLVDVAVEGHIVTLQGYVESALQRDLAEERAQAVPGVVGIQNRLVVAYSPDATLYR